MKKSIVTAISALAVCAGFSVVRSASATDYSSEVHTQNDSLAKDQMKLPDQQDTILSGDTTSINKSDRQQAGHKGEEKDQSKCPEQCPGTAGQTPAGVAAAGAESAPPAQVPAANTQVTEAQMKLAPYALMVSSSLMSAKSQLQGVKAQMQILDQAQAQTQKDQSRANQANSREFVSHFRDFSKGINSDLSEAKSNQAKLTAKAKGFPEIRESTEFQSLNQGIDEARRLNSGWQAKIQSQSYWKNREQARADIDALDKSLSNAIDQAKSFNSKQLNTATG